MTRDTDINPFLPSVPFWSPWKHQKTKDLCVLVCWRRRMSPCIKIRLVRGDWDIFSWFNCIKLFHLNIWVVLNFFSGKHFRVNYCIYSMIDKSLAPAHKQYFFSYCLTNVLYTVFNVDNLLPGVHWKVTYALKNLQLSPGFKGLTTKVLNK